MTTPIDGHTYGIDKITGYKTIDGLILGIDSAPACRGGRKAVRSAIKGLGVDPFTTAAVESAIRHHDTAYRGKSLEHWQVWHDFYQAATAPINTYQEWFHIAVGDSLTGVARENPELLTRLTRKLGSRSRWQAVVSEASFQERAEAWERDQVAKQAEVDLAGIDQVPTDHQQANLEESAAVVETNAAGLLADQRAQDEGQRYFSQEVEPGDTVTREDVRDAEMDRRDVEGVLDVEPPDEEGINVVGITLPAPAEPYFTAFVRERNTYKRVRLRSENRETAAQEVAKSNPGADLIEVFVHEGLVYTQQWAEDKALQGRIV